MFAVIRTGGKQYRVTSGDRLAVERLAAEPGTMIALPSVLMLGEPGQAPVVGTPLIDKAAVFAEVLEQTRGEKLIIFKKRRRKNYRRLKGHRQDLTLLKILAVSPTGEAPAFTPTPRAEKKPSQPAARAKKKRADDGAAAPAKKPAAKKASAAKGAKDGAAKPRAAKVKPAKATKGKKE